MRQLDKRLSLLPLANDSLKAPSNNDQQQFLPYSSGRRLGRGVRLNIHSRIRRGPGLNPTYVHWVRSKLTPYRR